MCSAQRANVETLRSICEDLDVPFDGSPSVTIGRYRVNASTVPNTWDVCSRFGVEPNTYWPVSDAQALRDLLTKLASQPEFSDALRAASFERSLRALQARITQDHENACKQLRFDGCIRYMREDLKNKRLRPDADYEEDLKLVDEFCLDEDQEQVVGVLRLRLAKRARVQLT